MTPRAFRALVVAWMILYLWWFSVPYGLHKQPSYVQEATTFAGRGALLPMTDGIAYPYALLALIASLGLLAIRNWARRLFVVLTALGLTLNLLVGVAVSGPFDSFLGSLLSICHGAVIAGAYSSNLRPRFATSARSDDAEQARGTNRQASRNRRPSSSKSFAREMSPGFRLRRLSSKKRTYPS